MISTATAHRPNPATSPKHDLEAIKVKQRATWSSGDYSMIGTTGDRP